MNMKTYLAKFNPQHNGGVYAISLVENPAMEGLFIALSKDEPIQLKEIDKEKRMLMGLVLEPNKPIYRNQGGEEFNIVFDEQTIEELSHSFFKKGYQGNSTIEHESSQKIEGVTFVESWIVENPEIDKSTNFGFKYPKGSWLATMKVDSETVWQDYVKTGKVQGFSIDALVGLEEVNLKSIINMAKQEESTLLQLLKDLPNQIATALGIKQAEVKFGSIMTDDGKLKIEYDGEMMMVGGRVWVMAEDGTEVAVPVGEHLLENGNTLVVKEEGIVDSFIESTTSTPSEETAPAEMAEPKAEQNNDEKIANEIGSAIKSILVKYGEQEAKITALETANLNLSKQIEEIGKQPASKGIKQPEQTSVALNKTGRLLQTIRKN